MIGKIKIFFFLFILNTPSSLLQLLNQNGLNIPSQTNQVAEKNAETNPNDPLKPHIYEVTDVIHQIDVKDEQNQVISNINDVIITNELDNLTTNINDGVNYQNVGSKLINGSLINELNQGKAVKTVDGINNIKTIFNSSTPLANGDVTRNLKTDNITVGGQNNNNHTNDVIQKHNITTSTINNNIIANNLTNSSIINDRDNVLNNNSSASNNGLINNFSISNGNVNVSNTEENLLNVNNVVLDENERINDDTTYNNTLLNNINEDMENDPNFDIAWRSDFPNKKNKSSKVKNTVNIHPQNGALKDNAIKNNVTLTANSGVSSAFNNTNLRSNISLTNNTNQINTLTNTSTNSVPVTATGQLVTPKHTDNITKINTTTVPNDDNYKSDSKSQELDATNVIEPDEDDELSFRSDFRRQKAKHAVKIPINSDPYSETNNAYRFSGKNETKHSKNSGINTDLNNVFMILNSGSIRDFRADLPDNDKAGEQQYNSVSDSNNNQNPKSDDSKLINGIINSSINKIASNILDPNNSIQSKNVFLILNSGTISNFQVNSRTPNDTKNNTLAKDTSTKMQALNKNKTKFGPESSFGVKSFVPFIDIKFRNDNLNSNKENLPKLSASIAQSNGDDLLNKDSLKTKLPSKPSNNRISPNQNKPSISNNNNNFGNPLPSILPNNLGIDLNSLNVLNGAIDMLNRLKWNTKNIGDNPKNDQKSRKEDTDHFKNCENCDSELQALNNEVLNQIKSNGESFDYSKINNLFDNDKNTDDLECPLSILFNQALQQNLEKLSKGDTKINNIYSYVNSLVEGKDDVINLVTKEIMKIPFSVDLRLQLTNFINEISKHLNSILCKLN